MPSWALLILVLVAAMIAGAVMALTLGPRIRRVIEQTPPPDLPEHLAPGWYVCCTRCGRSRTLASVGGVRLGGNRNAKKATIGWCRVCCGPRIIQVLHQDHLDHPQGPAAAAPRS